MNITIEQGQNLDVTTIKVKLKYPTNQFELFVWSYCPYSLKSQLGFEYKFLHYADIDYLVSEIFPYSHHVLKTLEQKTGFHSVPQIRIRHNQGLEESWASDSTSILKLLDKMFPINSLFVSENTQLHREVVLLEDWIDEVFREPYFKLLFLNKNNLSKVSKRWTEDEDSIINKAYLEMFKKDKINYYSYYYKSKNKSLDMSRKKLDEEILPLICEKLEYSDESGHCFLFGNFITAADLGLYAFLKNILEFEESNFITRRHILQNYIHHIEGIPLGKISGNMKQSKARKKMSLLETPPEEESAL